jgi:hypothetical protein
MDDGVRALEAELGAPPPAGLAEAVADGDLRRLAAAIAARRREQREQLAESGEAALRHVPALVRGPVKRIVGIR